MQALLLRHAQTRATLTSAEAAEGIQLSCIAWEVMHNKALELVASSRHNPLLFSYGSGCTPLIASHTVIFDIGSCVHSRRGGRPEEFLVQRVFLLASFADGSKKMVSLSKMPVPMSNGKGAWQHFTALTQFMPMLRRHKPQGIIVSHYAFDRAIYASVERKCRQRHELYYVRQAGGTHSLQGDLALQELTDWVVSTPCTCHDCHNSLKWALHRYATEDTEVVKNLHIVIESLRNGFCQLHGALYSFIIRHIEFRDPPVPGHALYLFWTALGVPSEFQKTVPGRVRVKFAQNGGHEKPFFLATKKPRKSHEKVTSKNATSNEKSSESWQTSWRSADFFGKETVLLSPLSSSTPTAFLTRSPTASWAFGDSRSSRTPDGVPWEMPAEPCWQQFRLVFKRLCGMFLTPQAPATSTLEASKGSLLAASSMPWWPR